ncbi:MAG: hypothetical protein H0Z32_01325 [Bacillaceae bacterium]|nr:hypothetical protein [Bacillaceae bacterium]
MKGYYLGGLAFIIFWLILVVVIWATAQEGEILLLIPIVFFGGIGVVVYFLIGYLLSLKK